MPEAVLDAPPPTTTPVAPTPSPGPSKTSAPAPKPAAPAAPEKRSPKAEMQAELKKRFGSGETADPAPAAAPKGDGSLEKKAGASESSPSPDAPAAAPKPGEQQQQAKTDPQYDKKQSPWKLMDQFKKRSVELESENLALKQRLESMGDAAKVAERMTVAEKRAQELEEHIRFVDYSKSDEFKTKYQTPYEAAWKRATAELRELSIADAAGNQRMVTPDDLLQLVNLPLGKAREVANQLYGDYANDVMEHRREIRTLFDQQQNALDDARKNGVETQKKQQEQWQQTVKQVNDQVKTVWDEANQKLRSHPEIGKDFTPIDGDEEGNSRLKKGYELADAAFTQNPLDPRLTPEQRKEYVERHAAVRNRAAAYGRLKFWLKQRDTRISELTKELEQFKSSEPGKGAPASVGTVKPQGGARESVFGALRNLGVQR